MRLPDDPRSEEFWTEHARLRNQNIPHVSQTTVRNLVEAWHQSPEWEALGPGTKREWKRHCGRIEDAWGPLEVRGIGPKQVLNL